MRELFREQFAIGLKSTVFYRYMAFLATAVANDFLDLAGSESCPLSQMQVQKLLYFSHGWHLALRGEPLTVEPFEAWDYGPVVRRLWERLRKYGNKPVTEKIPDYVFSGGKFSTIVSGIEISPESGGYASLEIVRSIWGEVREVLQGGAAFRR